MHTFGGGGLKVICLMFFLSLSFNKRLPNFLPNKSPNINMKLFSVVYRIKSKCTVIVIKGSNLNPLLSHIIFPKYMSIYAACFYPLLLPQTLSLHYESSPVYWSQTMALHFLKCFHPKSKKIQLNFVFQHYSVCGSRTLQYSSHNIFFPYV